MHKQLTPVLLAIALATAAVVSVEGRYDMAAHIGVINQSPAAEVIKNDAIATALTDAANMPDMPAGVVLTLDDRDQTRDRGALIN
jgi:hypothetical protein